MSLDRLEPRPIVELRSDVVDQIAAGEVVERPAHLVKELIENAIDAGATEVEVEFDHGGRSVRVTDDGVGIRPEDLPRALARHATSKITSAEDLWKLRSFGFRGEALASIAAVSRLGVTSLPRSKTEEGKASKITSEFGRVSKVEPASGNRGTTVSIQELFENVPARLKFMRSESAEGAQIRAVFKASAIAHPEAAFRLRSKGKTELSFKGGESFLARAQSVLGVKLHLAHGEFEGIKAEIAFSGPQDVLGNSKGLWFFVQNRWVQDRSLQAAVIESYRGLLMRNGHGEYPIAVIKLDAPDGEVDVNIHPTKSAVKFRDPSRAFRAVSRTLRAALETAPWVSAESRGSARASGATTPTAGFVDVPQSDRAPYSLNEFTRPYRASEAVKSFDRDTRTDLVTPLMESALIAPRFDSAELDRIQIKTKTLDTSYDQVRGTGTWSRLEILGQAGSTYIVCQDGDRMVFVDQHAAHERVAFERLMRAWKEKGENGTVETQSMLFPLVIDMEPEHIEALARHATDLSHIGISFEPMGPRTIAVGSIPAILKEAVVEKSLKQLAAASVERGGSFVFEEKIGDIFATMACHSVVRAGQALSKVEMSELLEQMDEFPLSSFCPHGRPVSVEYPFARLERDFGRTV